MYDPVCKFLVENFSTDFANWLLGRPVSLSTVSPTELSLEPIRADAMILLEPTQPSDDDVLHIEFQTNPEPGIPFRMIDYWVRIRRRYPGKTIRQVVIYLRRSKSPLVHQIRFEEGNTSHGFEVIRLWEQPFEAFLQSPGLLPFAVLSQVEDPAAALEQVVAQIRDTFDIETQKSVSASAAVLAGLVLEESLVQRIIGMDLLEESSVYQSIKQKGVQQGLQQGVQQGVQQERQATRSMVLRMLTLKLGEIPSALKLKVDQLPIEETRSLSEALLGFSTLSDLEQWLAVVEDDADSDGIAE